MKYLILLLLAVLATQAHPSEVVDNSVEVYGWSEIWDQILKFIEDAQNAVSDITAKLTKIFKEIQEKIKEITGIGSIEEIIEKIKNYILEMVGGASEVVKACIDKQNDTIHEIAVTARDAALKCVDKAQDQLKEIQGSALEVKDNVGKLVTATLKSGAKCILHPTTAVQCLTDLYKKLQDEGHNLYNQIKGVINSADGMLKDLNACQNDVQKYFFGEIDKVYTEVVDCSLAY